MGIISKTILWLMVLGLTFNMSAQDNHDYATPTGKTVLFRDVQNADRMVISMNEIQPLSKETSGLMIMFNLRTGLYEITAPLKLLSFTLSTEDQSYMDIFYYNSTIMIRRKLHAGSRYYYDYDLYDPMFTPDPGDLTWEVKVFFTGYFLWIETRNTKKLLSNKWHAPVFFGLDLPDENVMEHYLKRSSHAKIIFGDGNTNTVFMMPEEIMMTEFDYSELKDELQKNFCDDF